MEAKRKVVAIQEQLESQLKGMEQLGSYLALILSTTTTDPRLALICDKTEELKLKIASLVSITFVQMHSGLLGLSLEKRERGP